MDPRDKSTYIYDTEETYYKQYAESMFGVTMKKNGWDCVRHYEIMANACVPLFLGLDQCPENIMTTLPKKDLIAILKIVQDNGIEWFTSSVGQECWWEYSNRLDDHFERNCTTDHLATYLLDTVAKYK